MTVTVRGRDEVRRYLKQLPGQIEKVLAGAARAGAKVIAEEAKQTTKSDDVRDNVVVTKARVEQDRAYATITVKVGWARSVAIWEEFGTSPHIIRVADDRDRRGMSIARINKVQAGGTLVIGGQPVGKVVHHPGAQPHPFLRTARDTRQREAISAAQVYINSRISRGLIKVDPDAEADEA